MTKPFRQSIQDKAQSLIEDMCVHHCKVLPVRFDLRFPVDYQNDGGNREIQQFNKNLVQHFRNRGEDCRYLTVREQNKSANPHYHALVLVDGNKHQKPHAVHAVADHLWSEIVRAETSGLVHHCTASPSHPLPPLKMIRRPSSSPVSEEVRADQHHHYQQARDTALRHADYLAKEATKGNAPEGVREMLASQIRRKITRSSP